MTIHKHHFRSQFCTNKPKSRVKVIRDVINEYWTNDVITSDMDGYHHSVYMLTFKGYSEVYIGCHKSGRIDDGYAGSGADLIRFLNANEPELIRYHVLKTFASSYEASEYEALIVTRELVKNKHVLNMNVGGSASNRPEKLLKQSDKMVASRANESDDDKIKREVLRIESRIRNSLIDCPDRESYVRSAGINYLRDLYSLKGKRFTKKEAEFMVRCNAYRSLCFTYIRNLPENLHHNKSKYRKQYYCKDYGYLKELADARFNAYIDKLNALK